MEHNIKIGIGIDTGGTYTDAVIYDFEAKTILDTSKALTTKEDLSIGILEALDSLTPGYLKKAEIISLSTTLATNACVEEKGGIAKLAFFGGDRSVIDKYGKEYGLPPSGEMYIQESYSNFSGGFERAPDWEQFATRLESEFTGLDGIGVLEIYAMKNSAVVEKKAKDLLIQKFDVPVVCGHELFNELNCLQRGASTLLNARLFPVIREFIKAIKVAVEARGIGASIFIVRSDGSLMSDEFANIRPIETLLCGPAASVMGSARLSSVVDDNTNNTISSNSNDYKSKSISSVVDDNTNNTISSNNNDTSNTISSNSSDYKSNILSNVVDDNTYKTISSNNNNTSNTISSNSSDYKSNILLNVVDDNTYKTITSNSSDYKSNILSSVVDNNTNNMINSVVVDMGGTTTDIALIRNGVPVKAIGGARVGRWKTFVDGLYIKTFGLGGDSAVHYNDSGIILEDYRVVPLCAAAEKYPQIAENLRVLAKGGKKHIKYLHEHFILMKDISGNPRYSDDERTLCEALRNGPLNLRDAAQSIPGKDIFNFDASRLIKEGVIQTAGLTPTDLMHIKRDYERFPKDAALFGAQFVAGNLDISVDELCERVYDEVKRKLYVNIVKVLMENQDARYMKNGVAPEIERLINDSFYEKRDCLRKKHLKNEFVSVDFSTDFILTGVGAPIRIFLGDVAEMLGTKAVNPKHYEVANALGAIVGSVYTTNVVEVRPNYSVSGITGYTVSGLKETKVFKSAARAEEFAIREAKKGARAEAVRRGAKGKINVACSLNNDIADTGEVRIFLGTRATATAIGTFGL